MIKAVIRNPVHHLSLFKVLQAMFLFLEIGLADKPPAAPRPWLSHKEFLTAHLVHPEVLNASSPLCMATCPTNLTSPCVRVYMKMKAIIYSAKYFVVVHVGFSADLCRAQSLEGNV